MAEQNTKTKFTEGTITEASQGLIGGVFKKQPSPAFLDERAAYFDSIFTAQQAIIAAADKPEITITLKDGKEVKGKAFETTPMTVAKGIFKKVPEKFVGAKVTYSKKYTTELSKIGDCVSAEDDVEEEGGDCCGGHEAKAFEIYDLERPLEGDCAFELIDFECPEGKQVFWHSSAHILGETLELNYGSHLCIGPPLKNGFFYDSYMGEEKISNSNFAEIESTFQKIVSEKQPFQRIVLSKTQALELFKHNPFKVQLITNKIPDTAVTTAYKCGKLIDLCTGPHLPHTGYVKAFKVEKNSAAYWLGKNTNDGLQRVYGIAFPSKKELDAHVKLQEELAKRDHRNIGKQHELFTFHPFSPGCAFFYPNGAYIYNKLIETLRKQYRIRGYSEVITPNLFDAQLWKISGHWAKYKENMFLIKNDNEEHGFKPMNCPSHCLMFDSIQRSYRDLPIRYADFGVLHRNEVHGALSGLTRVRRFQQDDAHIFCTMDQVMNEIKQTLDFIDYMYGLFGFKYSLALSTRPDNFIGEIEMWDQAENALKAGLEAFGKPWVIKPKDGAFYGPKIDIQLYDAFDRGHQCGTVQLDFNLPIRFNLQYRANDSKTDIETQRKKQETTEESLPLSKAEKKEMAEMAAQVEEEPDSLIAKKSKKSEDTSLQVGGVEKKYTVAHHHLRLGFQRPVIVHRAVLGSLERFLAILCEQTAGKWPFWLSPRQIKICPISNKVNEFAQAVCDRLSLEGYQASVDYSEGTLNKKVRNAQLEQYNYIAVVGEEEQKGGYVDLRIRDQQERLGKYTVNELIELFKSQDPHQSSVEKNLWAKLEESSSSNIEYSALEKELQDKMFFEADGNSLGAKDKEVYETIKNAHIDKFKFPNLAKWLKVLAKH